jgi:hypothetical protein
MHSASSSSSSVERAEGHTLITIGSSSASAEDANRAVPARADVIELKAFILMNDDDLEG